MPCLLGVLGDARAVADIEPSDEPVLLPAMLLRFTHHTINSELAFGDDHENRQESIMKLFDGFFRGHADPRKIEPLYVFKHVGPDGNTALFSRNNRRLIACLLFQAVRRTELVQVPCRIFRSDDTRRAPTERQKTMAEWFAEGYDAADTRANCDGLGYSIFPRPGVSSHRGYPLFNGGQTTLRALRRACERERSRPAGDADLLAAADMVLEQARLRTTASGDAETLTFASGSGDEGTLQPRAAAAEGRGKGYSTQWRQPWRGGKGGGRKGRR
mmetsp:Transcript_148112/g.474106  ORF Transcript_148112/g.474106 Transcript_148112/m.474106 type:complete len:272 (+) Transcript_148112:1828-2643(+)